MAEGAKAISEVQASEERAAKLVAGANADRDKMLMEAREKAAKMVADAEGKAEGKRAVALKAAIDDFDNKSRKALEKASEDSKQIRASKLGERARARIARELVDKVLGA